MAVVLEIGALYCHCIFKLFPLATLGFFNMFVVCVVCAVFWFYCDLFSWLFHVAMGVVWFVIYIQIAPLFAVTLLLAQVVAGCI